MTEIHNLGLDIITCHAWNKDQTEVAVCPNSNEVHVYKHSNSGWKSTQILEAHHMNVMCLDWAPKTNRIVTCGADKDAYVWNQDDAGKWIPAWVILRMNRAAVCVKWSPLENKFAVGSGDRMIAVSYFVSGNNWWLSKHIKRPIRSTVTAIDWHPDNKVIASGSTDFKVRVFGAYIKEMEDAPSSGPWGAESPLGTLLAEFPNSPNGGGWVHSVAFSPTGNKLCWVAHNSSICVADATKGNAVMRLSTEHLPFLSCVWIGPNLIVAAGHSCMPMLYSFDLNGQLYFVSKLDNSQKKEAAGISAMRKFQSLDRQARTETNDSALDSIHQNTITCVRRVSSSQFSTSGLDGQLVVWDLKILENAMAGLKIM
ncbi:actin-related protein 2/3 complex subunit 1A-B isoform X3 [Microplitis demolitor]|uniref:actin-related protein 2/3 complex subunit 1A-B isoform X3 n=1 Tax=Microplitis demolitor TaxID=69319 RepID=UPI0004CD5172|nr:actin-related protein 2/3 complex subunit 1A-B isoform X3 [Microplitis demolitor]